MSNTDTTKGMNPYMTNSLYNIDQSLQGNRANSIYGNTSTTFLTNNSLQFEEVLTGSLTTTFGGGILGFTSGGGLYIPFTDQQKITPPQCLGFVTLVASGQTYPMNYYDLQFSLGVLNCQTLVNMGVTKLGVNIVVGDQTVGSDYTFEIKVIKPIII